MATLSTILTWKIPLTEECYTSWNCKKVGGDLATEHA